MQITLAEGHYWKGAQHATYQKWQQSQANSAIQLKLLFHVAGLGNEWLRSFILNLYQNIRSKGNNMSSEVLLSNIIPFAGSGLVGYATGFALKKILKWMLIIVGFLAGMFFVGVQLLQKYGYVSTVNWD